MAINPLLDQLRSSLASRYDVERDIGRGAMATVYLAHGLRNQRQAAIKVFDPDLGAVLGADRFLGEIRVTANLQHPNLLPLFDSGEAGGLLFYVMPYVEGEACALVSIGNGSCRSTTPFASQRRSPARSTTRTGTA